MSEDREALVKQALADQTRNLERLSDTIVRAAEGRRDLPASLEEVIKQIATLTTECGEAVEEHLDDGLSEDTFELLQGALEAIRGGLDSLLVFKALEGSSYETRTVAND
ncbi:hypothetical protein [Beijerinckia indica]|uniref:Uncharacterized protein n=1 Tax=Beijerinckia indica subsp. indica (strain ATCC 9039 / DSM 1715 / NCIMB 8712) TaxID=395963 RepID=B2IAY2_BEII9|nr:hypothetical protein [Beijerinckia indica]ACB93682.1 hypothetical protein Bind_0023 [Beijerinckia indica subsp. indica ATCC 9039]